MDIPYFVYPLISWQTVGCFHFGAVHNNASVNIHNSPFCVDLCFHFFGVYPRVELLGHMVTLCLTLSGAASCAGEFQFFHSLTNGALLLLLAIPVGVTWHLVGVWPTCLMTNDFGHLPSLYLYIFHCLSLFFGGNVYSYLLLIFKLSCLSLLLSCKSSFYSSYKFFIRYMIWNIFSYSVMLLSFFFFKGFIYLFLERG